MTGIDAQLTREFFELNGFRVQTCWAQNQRADSSIQLYVDNPDARDGAADLLLTTDSIRHVRRALVEVRPWHTERLYPSVIDNNAILTLFAKPENTLHANDFFNNEPFVTILVTSELPSNPEQRLRSIAALEASPVDHVVEFPLLLRHLIGAVNINSAYTGSNTLQLLQLLKRYRLIQNQQMEFLFPMEAPFVLPARKAEAAPPPVADEGDKYEEDEWE